MLLDSYFEKVNVELRKIPWLNSAFGAAKYLEDKDKGSYPAIWEPNNAKYLNLESDSLLGNYTYIENQGVTDVKSYLHAEYYKVKFSIILYFDWNKVFPNPNFRSIEDVKFQVLARLRGLPFSITKIEERKLYREYTNREKQRQYQMRPCGGLRIDCFGSFNSVPTACNLSVAVCPVTSITGVFRNIEEALASTSDGEFFALTKDNDHGSLPFIYELNPTVSFQTEIEAENELGADVCFTYGDQNPKGYFLKSGSNFAGLVAINRRNASIYSSIEDAEAGPDEFYYYFNPEAYGSDGIALVNKKGL